MVTEAEKRSRIHIQDQITKKLNQFFRLVGQIIQSFSEIGCYRHASLMHIA